MSDDKAAVTRRWVLVSIGALLNGAVAFLVAIPVVGYLLGPIRKNGGYNSWIDLGDVSQFAMGQTRLASFVNPKSMPWDGATAKAACWVRRTDDEKFQVFAINCAHLGCPVRWFEESKLFMCPCHGGAYYQDGSRASGPPERGLFEYKYKVVNNALSIDVHGLPTLATEARLNNPLVQIQGADGKKSGGCGCQG